MIKKRSTCRQGAEELQQELAMEEQPIPAMQVPAQALALACSCLWAEPCFWAKPWLWAAGFGACHWLCIWSWLALPLPLVLALALGALALIR